ncbi:MAG: B12-binding domain-containing radical SAM protein [Vallitaleaceae bacterium]|nr:B12-binding domain-containing radical SAM protein [Vallitaleaceae bacterium]
MKIALLSPAGAMHRFTGSFKKAIHYAPLTMTTIAAVITNYLDAEVSIYDETIETIPLNLDVDLVMITAITGTAPRAYAFADYYRAKGIKVIIGGVHATLRPIEAKEHCDSVLMGFGEILMPEVLIDLRLEKLKPFYNDKDRKGELEFTLPNRDLLPKGKYITNSSLEASRGCSNACNFCAVNALYTTQVYKKSIKDIVAEVEGLNTKSILFVDVNLLADRSFAIDLFKALTPLKKWWYGLSTADVVQDKEVFDLMVKSGCKGLLIGFESVTTSSLQSMNKYRNDVVNYSELMKKMHANGISVNGTFCFGTDEDDLDVFDRTVEMVLKLKIDLPRYSILTPFPGTPLYEQLTTEKRISDEHWAMYDVQHVVYEPKKMSQKQLMDGFVKAWRDTYSVGSIVTRIARPHVTFPLSIMTNNAYRYYADKLETFTRERMIDNSDIV